MEELTIGMMHTQQCGVCGYDVAGLAAAASCPECGAPASQRSVGHRELPLNSLPLTPYGALVIFVVVAALFRPAWILADWVLTGTYTALALSFVLGIAARTVPPVRSRSTAAGVCLAVVMGLFVAGLFHLLSEMLAGVGC
jgi:hypothetical protein